VIGFIKMLSTRCKQGVGQHWWDIKIKGLMLNKEVYFSINITGTILKKSAIINLGLKEN